jgi:hypothetical protein
MEDSHRVGKTNSMLAEIRLRLPPVPLHIHESEYAQLCIQSSAFFLNHGADGIIVTKKMVLLN